MLHEKHTNNEKHSYTIHNRHYKMCSANEVTVMSMKSQKGHQNWLSLFEQSPISMLSLWSCWWRGCGYWRCWWSDEWAGRVASCVDGGRGCRRSIMWRRRPADRWLTPDCRGSDWWLSSRSTECWSACRNSDRSHTDLCEKTDDRETSVLHYGTIVTDANQAHSLQPGMLAVQLTRYRF